MEIEQIKVESLIPYAKNSRTHSDEQVAQVAGSIREFGFTNPVLIGKENDIIAGHGRVLAARRLGLTDVPCIRLGHLTEAQKRAYVIADNKLAMNAGWDEELLKLELISLRDEEAFDLELTGFNETELESLLDVQAIEGNTDSEEIPEAPQTPVSVIGDIWTLGRHRLMCGDSTSIDAVKKLMLGEKADMMFTDPPYGVNYDGGHFHSGDVNIKRKREKLAADESTKIYNDFLPVALNFVDGPCYMWFAGSKARDVYNALHDNECQVHALIIWHKTNATYAAMNAQYKQRHEPCIYFKPKGSTLKWCGASTESTLWSQERDGINEFHPTQKPIALAAKAVANHEVKTVVDFFGGSGSTLMACEKTGKTARLMEFEPKYIDVIITRWQDFTGQKAVHESGKTFDEIKGSRGQ